MTLEVKEDIYKKLHGRLTIYPGIRTKANRELLETFEYWKARYSPPDDGKATASVPGAPKDEKPFSDAHLERVTEELNDLILEAFKEGKMGKPYVTS